MALSSDATMTMPVQPMYSNYGMGGFGSNGMWGQDFIWLIILFLFAGGWGNGFGNNGQGSETRADIQRGFDTQSIIGKLDGITQGICDSTFALNNNITNGFHGVDNAVCQLGYQTQVGLNALGTQLTNRCCAPVTACGIRTRTRYSVVVATSATSGTFRMLGNTCPCPTNHLRSINGTAPATGAPTV